MIDTNTLAAAREVGKRLSVRRDPVTVEEVADFAHEAAEMHEADDLELIVQLGCWLAEQLIPAVRADAWMGLKDQSA